MQNNNGLSNAEIRHNYAVAKARNRGNISEEWHKTNKLTSATLAEFKSLMKKADKEFDRNYKS